ncbi:MAG: SGNH/GDSL hydrolase family protein [Candidatus Euphemobacter frigidus]|nr:SGNH/GDSL hydrolase family protein [Candidatus Euphemobacter frigidus]MDP8276386.1 SGNH/GDSL hydrolase family protein [Candidatus Euphemobacter frigidus]
MFIKRQIKNKFVFNIVGKLATLFLSVFIFSLILDWTLGLFGFPSKGKVCYSHPPNRCEIRKNIEFQYRFESNSRGLRYREIPEEKPDGSYRIWVAGDSFVEGLGVDAEDRFTEYLERSFSHSEQPAYFINGGLVGTGPLEYGRLFLKIGLDYNPDGLLICLYANDLINTQANVIPGDLYYQEKQQHGIEKLFRNLWPRMFLLVKKFQSQHHQKKTASPSDFFSIVSQKALRDGIPQERIAEWKEGLSPELVEATNKKLFYGNVFSRGLLYPHCWISTLDIKGAKAEASWKAMSGLLEEIIKQARSHSIKVGLIFIPSRFQYNPESHKESNPWIQGGAEVRAAWLNEETEIQRRLALLAKQLDLPFLDMTTDLRRAMERGAKLNWEFDDHWTSKGHKVAGEIIREWIDREQVFSFLPKSITEKVE